MNSLERKNLSFKNRNFTRIQSNEELISLNTTKSFNHNKLKFLNLVDKNALIQNLDKNIKKINNDQKSSYANNIPNKKIILNKLLLNQIKKDNEKELFQTRTNMHQIQTIEINKNNDYKNSLSINNISSYRSKVIKNDNKNTKKNFMMESHHLINSLLKNQNKIPKKEKTNELNNELELSLSSSGIREQKIKLDISPSKDSNKLGFDNNNKNGEILYPSNIKRINKTNLNENQNLNNSSFDNNNNKENKDINLVKNKKEILISPLYNIDSNNSSINRTRMYRSPLRMADVFMLKKHHSINPGSNKLLTDNNNFVKEGLNNKKITAIKNEKDTIDREKILKENIKRIQNIQSNLMNKEKENNNDMKNKRKYLENTIAEKNNIINENKAKMNAKLIESIKDTTIDSKIYDKKEKYNLENKFYGRNNIFEIPTKKQLSQTIDNKINKTISNFHMNKSSSINNIASISPIKDANNRIKIKVNKIKLETIDERTEINRPIHSIRRRFMNSKNKYNNLSPDCIKRKMEINENEPKEININKINAENIQKKEIKEIPKINIINNIDEAENIPEIKFQSESEKENRIKRNKKYKYIKKEKEAKERNINPSNKLKRYNSFSFGTLFSLSSKTMSKKNMTKSTVDEKNKDEENILSEIDKKNRYFSPCKNELKKNELNIMINEEEKTIKKINSESNLINKNINDTININKKQKKKVTLSLDIKIENINTTKPVIRYNISQLLPNNKLHTLKKNNINIYIFSLDKSNIIKFDLRKKRFNKIKISDIEDISDSFQLNYIYDNTLLYNTLTGLFILTGEKTNILYYYDKEHDIIIKLCQFNFSHNLGCLLLDKNKIFILGGKNTNICEYYDFDTEKIELIPELNNDRANSSFCFCKDKIYGFFGYSYKTSEYLYNIEYIDKNKLDKWNQINLDIKIESHLINMSLFNYDKEQNKIYIYGGKQEQSDNTDEKYYYIYDIEKNNFEKIENVFYNIKKEYKRFTVRKYEEEKNKNEFLFDKHKQFIEISEEFEIDKNNQNISVISDSDNNIHFLTKNRNYVNIYQYLK